VDESAEGEGGRTSDVGSTGGDGARAGGSDQMDQPGEWTWTFLVRSLPFSPLTSLPSSLHARALLDYPPPLWI